MPTLLSKGEKPRQAKVLVNEAELLHCSQRLQKDTWVLIVGMGIPCSDRADGLGEESGTLPCFAGKSHPTYTVRM